MSALFGVLALIGVVAVHWDLQRKGQQRAVRTWQWAGCVIVPLALVVIVLAALDHELAGALRGVLVFAFAVGTVAATIAGRPRRRG